MSNTGSDADSFVTNKMFKPVHKYFTADPTRRLVLEDWAWTSSSGEQMIDILPLKNY
jgi:hypothetical protein